MCGLPFNKLRNVAREICKLGNITYFCKFSKLGKKKCLITQKKNTHSKIAAPGSTSAGSFEVVLPNKDEDCIGYEKSEPRNLKK